MPASKLIETSPVVAAALTDGRPVVALESAIISHGMPYPQNLETARRVEAIVREKGAVPASIGVLDGKVRIGLSDDELERFGQDQPIQKVSRRDLPAVLDGGQMGATTVAATMYCASLAGIRFQATGGIGGVHRGGEVSLDVSADLAELARTQVTVVCSGPKAVLDIGRTLEVLETLGVPVVGYRTSECPAFYCRTSGHKLPHQVESPDQAARLAKTSWDLGLAGGLVIANPVPAAQAMDAREVEEYIEAAMLRAREAGVAGRELTPFLLNHLSEHSGQASLKTNISLVLENAALAAEISFCFSEL